MLIFLEILWVDIIVWEILLVNGFFLYFLMICLSFCLVKWLIIFAVEILLGFLKYYIKSLKIKEIYIIYYVLVFIVFCDDFKF